MAKPVYRRAELWQMGLLILSLVSHSEGSTIIEVENGGDWGGWQEVKMCPTDFYANGFSLRVERSVGKHDDTALNGIRLFCKHITYPIEDIMVESPGHWGDWTSKQACGSGYLDSFQLRVEARQGKGDDTAANNMNVHCSSGDILHGDGTGWGSWGRWSSRCPNGVCGMQVKVEGPQGRGDDTALNDVRMICC
ncbi:vitelline membrane outer layer protein 1-like [Alosa pseudoharengus]|uniref:vitelline membrane outer layer protein 1-like n=1 Tax=Alosa pseudoharengus TaxID=34774 RepID=UPI003F8A43D6